jgi:hypothetical protein
MPWYSFIDIGTPLVFSPKVTPDPTAAERLEEKFQRAIRQLNPGVQPGTIRTFQPLPESMASSV